MHITDSIHRGEGGIMDPAFIIDILSDVFVAI